MRSIRLSLMVYFLGLLSVALGVASFLVYQTAQSTLAVKDPVTGRLIEAQYEERAREAAAHRDRRLLAQAKSLAGRVRARSRWDRIRGGQDAPPFHLHGLAIFSTQAGPCPPLNNLANLLQLAPNWYLASPFLPPRPPRRGGPPFAWNGLAILTAQAVAPYHSLASLPNAFGLWKPWLAPPRSPWGRRWPPSLSPAQFQMWHHEWIELSLSQEVPWDEGDSPGIAYRIETNSWSRPLLPDRGVKLDLPNESDFEPNGRLTWAFDDYCLADGSPVRRARFRALLNLQEPPDNGPGRGPPRWGYRVPAPALIIQCATDAGGLEATLAGLREQRDNELGMLHAETAASLAGQRNALLAITSVTFAATVLGSFALVWLGLLPLRRLSDAVSQVSPRDFRLPLDDRSLPLELRPIAERLIATLDLLKRAFAREKQATADISHELRTPLAALLTTAELALRKPRSAEQYRELFEDCRLSAQQMNHIVERLLTLARLDAGVDLLRQQPVDLAELAEQCATVVRPLAEARGLHLSVYTPAAPADQGGDGPARMLADPIKLREVLNNLLHNAIQYNRPEGRIDLTVARDNGHVRLEVQDTGIGIAPEARERIFERFYRADPSRNADDLHAGLGLAIVKEYVDLMGGRITVNSQEGQGSTFRVELPVRG